MRRSNRIENILLIFVFSSTLSIRVFSYLSAKLMLLSSLDSSADMSSVRIVSERFFAEERDIVEKNYLVLVILINNWIKELKNSYYISFCLSSAMQVVRYLVISVII